MANEALDRDGYWVLRGAVTPSEVEHLLQVFTQFLVAESKSVRARSSRGHVYAARNLIDSTPDAIAFRLTQSTGC
ncbi:hypothetical protein [Rhodopirellula sp. P2]|uniref:hypothetical protein n=1 Tax=Rhodopirellula sp. P2 TaxID=2127060 RepID=UPI002368793E|nr:hypothetical protein [Rhodopirellula sp. P2]WDQ17817.1 hypothetical protein PSR62_04510 [Rhodopirellula sp. P2]